MRVDAIVNAANGSLLGGGGVDGAIHRAAGPELQAECSTLGGCRTGEARITAGYRLPARYVIHTVGPVWHGGGRGEKELLAACYRSSLELAAARGCETVAFPLISAGACGYPKEEAMETAAGAITDFLESHEMTVFLALYGETEFLRGKKIFREVQEYIDDVYVREHSAPGGAENSRRRLWREDPEEALKADLKAAGWTDAAPEAAPAAKKENRWRREREQPAGGWTDAAPEAAPAAKKESRWRRRKDSPAAGMLPGAAEPRLKEETFPAAEAAPAPLPAAAMPDAAAPDWEELLRRTDEGFSQTLMRMIDERGMTDAECYRRANVDRKLFSKIRSNPAYRPSKPTVFAFAVALELTLPETEKLLRRAGFAISHSSRFDIVMEYFIRARKYNIFEINEVLFQFDMPLLGSGLAGG